ncbi:MAG: hypothetical protein NC082_04085 [Clostridiales bacterium]|nr:hypothetical protein [Clostridiales bacterium]
MGNEWEEEVPDADHHIYKRKLYIDGKHELIQTDAPEKNGSYIEVAKNGGEIVEVVRGSSREDGPTLIQDSKESSASDLSDLSALPSAFDREINTLSSDKQESSAEQSVSKISGCNFEPHI